MKVADGDLRHVAPTPPVVEAWEGYEPRPLDEAESKVFREFYARLGDTLAVRVKHVIDADALRKHDLERSDTAADFEAF